MVHVASADTNDKRWTAPNAILWHQQGGLWPGQHGDGERRRGGVLFCVLWPGPAS